MRMIICGMGEVGRHLALELTAAGHDIVAVDASHDALEIVESSMDVLTLRGHAALPETLRQAGADKARLVAAVTDDDETNLVACLAARDLGARFTVARLGNERFFPDRTGWVEDLLGSELALCPGLLAGGEVVRLTRAATVSHVEDFAGHLVQVTVTTVDEGVPATGKAATGLPLPERCRVLAVVRGGEAETPESIPHLQPEDHVVVSGPARSLYQADRLFRDVSGRRGKAVVVGGGALGQSVATELLEIMGQVVIADRSTARCEELAEALTGVEIARGDGTSLPFLEELDVRHARAFVATTGADEVNLMATLLSKKLGAERSIALLHRADYAGVYEALGIDATVSPRLLVSREILRFLQRQEDVVQSRLPDGSHVLELQVVAGGRLEGKRLFDLDLPHGVAVAAVARGAALEEGPELAVLRPGDVAVLFVPDRALAGARRALFRS